MNYINLDIIDLNPVDNITYINDIRQKEPHKKVVKDHIIQIFKSIFIRRKRECVDILFYGTSINNQRAFEQIIKNTKYSYYNIKDNDDFEISQYMLWSVFFIIPLICFYFRCSNHDRQKIKRNKIKYLLTYGKFIVSRRILKKYKPKVLIMANDHSNMNRCFLRNAISLGIKTIYIQHASVSCQFPLLEFDYSFLDGKISFDAYKNISKDKSLVFLSGPCRFDYMREIGMTHHEKYIGLSINEFDDFYIVSNICLKLLKDGYKHIKVRPHPSMGDWHKEWFEQQDIVFSSPFLETPGDYLSSLYVQVSNVSGIHLDAVMLKVPSIIFQLSEQSMPDIFSFYEKNIVSHAKSYDELLSLIQNVDNIKVKDSDARYFVASYGTSIEFNVGLFISHTIDYLIDCNFNNNDVLRHMPDGILTYSF